MYINSDLFLFKFMLDHKTFLMNNIRQQPKVFLK